MTDTWHVVVRRDDGWYTLCGFDLQSDQWARMHDHVSFAAPELYSSIQEEFPEDVLCEACSLMELGGT
jgi:hypothetical protein